MKSAETKRDMNADRNQLIKNFAVGKNANQRTKYVLENKDELVDYNIWGIMDLMIKTYQIGKLLVD
jgi:hypothetical protein